MKMLKTLNEAVRIRLKRLIIEGDAVEMHRCMDGKIVPFGCDASIVDIEGRIEDASHSRDMCPGRTDSREHYNGILKVLRRKLRRAHKQNLGGDQI